MGPGLSSALVVTVAYPRSPRPGSSRVLRVPLSSLRSMMNGLHRQGAVVTDVGGSSVQAEPDASAESGTPQPTTVSVPSRKRSRSKNDHGDQAS